jgi:hypothetical protein
MPMIALTAAVVLSQVPLPVVLAWAQMIVWIFAIDDLANAQVLMPKDMRRKAKEWYSLVANWPPTGGVNSRDELTVILMDLAHIMSRSSLFGPLCEYWATRLRSHVEGMAQEFQYSLDYREYGPEAFPSMDEYLRGGIDSMGYPFLGAMVMILCDDSSVMDHIELISKMMDHASLALRLYNDVATLDKEIKICEINPILMVYHDLLDKNQDIVKEDVLAKAKQRILKLADSYAQKSYELAKKFKTDSGQIEETSCRLVAMHAYFYGRVEQDFHTTSQTKMYQMFGIS